jgi:hypothetical protein
MKWTKERPKQSGWYWVDDGEMRIVWVDFSDKIVYVYYVFECGLQIDEIQIYKQEYTEWAGPIPEPED